MKKYTPNSYQFNKERRNEALAALERAKLLEKEKEEQKTKTK